MASEFKSFSVSVGLKSKWKRNFQWLICCSIIAFYSTNLIQLSCIVDRSTHTIFISNRQIAKHQFKKKRRGIQIGNEKITHSWPYESAKSLTAFESHDSRMPNSLPGRNPFSAMITKYTKNPAAAWIIPICPYAIEINLHVSSKLPIHIRIGQKSKKRMGKKKRKSKAKHSLR